MTSVLTRSAASAAIESSAWRFVLGTIVTSVPVGSMAEGLRAVDAAIGACGPDSDGHLRADLRSDRVELTLQTAAVGALTDVDISLSRRISGAVAALGLITTGVTSGTSGRSVQTVELAIDAMDIAAIRPFWRAVMGYGDEPGGAGPTDAVIDPVGQGPSIWFQQMDEPRLQRNRIHFDLSVPHDEAPGRIKAALDAGGVLVSDAAARRFWILADVEGNEVCVCTWQDREPSDA